MTDAENADALHRYVTACSELEGADPGALVGAAVIRDGAWHDLLVATGMPCDCDAGTCPGVINA
jgi:hypothetical protein